MALYMSQFVISKLVVQWTFKWIKDYFEILCINYRSSKWIAYSVIWRRNAIDTTKSSIAMTCCRKIGATWFVWWKYRDAISINVIDSGKVQELEPIEPKSRFIMCISTALIFCKWHLFIPKCSEAFNKTCLIKVL